MRATFFNTLKKIAHKDPDFYLLTADLGYKLFDPFIEEMADRFYDVGVAEGNMIGLAAGLALCGKNVYCYSIIPFLVMRAFEQIRIDIDYHNLSIKLVGVGGGFTYGLEGITHFGLEDIALMKSLPNMTIVVPADPFEAQALAELSYKFQGPMYIRLGRTGEPSIHKNNFKFEIGKAMILSEGKQVALIATGNMVYTTLKAKELLKQYHITPTIVNMHTIKPLDSLIIQELASSHDAIFTIEEHYINGGFGSSVAEILAEIGFKGLFYKIGIPQEKIRFIGRAEYLRKQFNLTPEGLVKRIVEKIRGVHNYGMES